MPNNTLSITDIINETARINASNTIAQHIVYNPMPTWVNPFTFARIDRSDERKYLRYRQYDWITEWETLDNIRNAITTVAMLHGTYITAGHDPAWDPYNGRYKHVTAEDAAQHTWHRALQDKFQLHAAIKDAVKCAPPDDRHQLILEWPHVSETDPNRLAYTRDERAGKEDRQTITTVGKYLRRHFSRLTDTQIRDITMRHGSFKFELWDTTEKIIASVQDGPASCMQWDDEPDEWSRTNGRHPYAVYAPEYGWRAAVRLDGSGNIVGRCLVNESDGMRIFVRSYAHKQDGYSHSDEALEVWLRDQGFTKAVNWEGCKLKRIDSKDRWGDSSFIAPYLDGHPKGVADCGDYLMVREGGEYWFENTDGTATRQNTESCECCGDNVDQDDMTWVGVDEDTRVCSSCIDHTYTYVYGRRGNQYYQHEDRVIYCEYDQEHYDTHYLSDNNMVELHNGDICPSDQAVYLEARDEYWHHEDEDVVHCEHDDSYEHVNDAVQLHDHTWAHTDNAWCCTISGDYYHEDDGDAKVALCDIETKMHHCAHEDNLDFFIPDLDDIADAVADMII
jgi:hypothetical protein